MTGNCTLQEEFQMRDNTTKRNRTTEKEDGKDTCLLEKECEEITI